MTSSLGSGYAWRLEPFSAGDASAAADAGEEPGEGDSPGGLGDREGREERVRAGEAAVEGSAAGKAGLGKPAARPCASVQAVLHPLPLAAAAGIRRG